MNPNHDAKGRFAHGGSGGSKIMKGKAKWSKGVSKSNRSKILKKLNKYGKLHK